MINLGIHRPSYPGNLRWLLLLRKLCDWIPLGAGHRLVETSSKHQGYYHVMNKPE